jgi:hypothetical protein
MTPDQEENFPLPFGGEFGQVRHDSRLALVQPRPEIAGGIMLPTPGADVGQNGVELDGDAAGH